MILHGWGRYPKQEARLWQPHTLPQQTAAIARGMGRSYGDSALASNIVTTRFLDFLLEFDPMHGTLRCEAGVTLATLLDVFVPRGWFLPVTPGTQYVTVGGAIASDVHGKNHHVHGCFSEYVENIELRLADGSRLLCSRQQYADLFHATCGGMGLTGLILSATLKLRRIQTTQMIQTTYKTAHLSETLACFAEHHQATYSVAWIDCLSTGKSLGRSLIMLGEHAQEGELRNHAMPQLSIPMLLPHQLLNRYTTRVFNSLYYHRTRRSPYQQTVNYQSFFYPLDRIRHWNRLYGRNGFLQYQCVIPYSNGLEGLQQILQCIAQSERGSFLAVLKALGSQNANLLSFPLAGYTLALDFKYTSALLPFLERLDALLLELGGRLYLTKDARMSPNTFRRSYPTWEHFQQVRAAYGAIGHFVSRQSQRLGLDK